MTRKRSLSGIKPTGQPHWGNYFGMIQPAIALADEHEAFYFVADLHALTSVRDPEALRRDSRGIAAVMIACGLDAERAVLWRQSDVPEVLELAWLLSCCTTMGLLERAHSWKDARARGKDITHGVVSYPVLMAADILLYDSDLVPVGKDQLQHLEMARDMATFFNVAWMGQQPGDEDPRWDGRKLKRPEAIVQTETAIVPGVDGQKMSKSYDNYIPIFASAKELKAKVMSIKTDSTPFGQPLDPDACNVFALFRLFASAEEIDQLAGWYRAGSRDGQPFGYGHAKQALLAKAEAHFGPRRARYEELMAHPDELDALLTQGAERARAVALGVMARVRAATGLGQR